MSTKNLSTEARPGEGRAGGTENNGTHREFPLDNSNSLLGNKWGKENNKFFGEIGSSPCNPRTKNEDQMDAYPQEKNIPDSRIRLK